MITVPVAPGGQAYDVHIGEGLLAQTGTFCRTLFPDCRACALVTDSTVGPLYAETVSRALRDAGITPHVITVPAGEPSKSFAVLEQVSREMIRAGLDRKAFLVALGGGVIGDLAGFAASVFFRGIPYVQIPTTIVSQVDSSVGGKTGINTAEGKNLIGTFHQPRLVLADTGTLATLPPREYNEGFAEIIKHAAIRDAGMLPLIAEVAADPARIRLPELIAQNVRIKAAIVTEDPFETKGLRALLNFGHTIGHGIEATAGYGQLLHGEAISLGLRAALDLSVKVSALPAAGAAALLDLLRLYQLPLTLPESIGTAEVMEKLGRDKKFNQGAIRFILLRRTGDAFVSKDITREQILAAVDALRTPP